MKRRVVIEREWVVGRHETRDDVTFAIQHHARGVARQAMTLAGREPPYLEESPLAIYAYNPDATGRIRIVVRCVMNLDKGYRLVVLPGGPSP